MDARPRLVAVRRGGPGHDRRFFVILIRADHTATYVEAYRWCWQARRAARRLVDKLAHCDWADPADVSRLPTLRP